MSPLGFFIAFLSLICYSINAVVINIEDRGAIANDSNITTCNSNTAIFNKTLETMKAGDTLLIPKNKIFWFNGGIYGKNLQDLTIQIDGSISYQNHRDDWPTSSNGHVLECMHFENVNNITFTSSDKVSKGLINGNGARWWGYINYAIHDENRPRLLHIGNSTNIKIEYLYFKNSPYWNVLLEDVKNVEVQYTNISARRTNIDYHDLFDIGAFNTDGFDVSGTNIHIHDCEIWNDDDTIAVKGSSRSSQQSDCSSNMLFERLNASGVGLTIGSIGPSSSHTCVDNITFRDVYMHRTFKGIYMKSRPGSGTGQITNVLYENIVMDKPTQVPIWIGPQQAVYHGACSLLWPEVPFVDCPVPSEITWANITLRNITINSPRHSPGVILGNKTNPMKNIIFDNVVVNNPGNRPWGDKYYDCEAAEGIAIHGTYPVPPCFNSTR